MEQFALSVLATMLGSWLLGQKIDLAVARRRILWLARTLWVIAKAVLWSCSLVAVLFMTSLPVLVVTGVLRGHFWASFGPAAIGSFLLWVILTDAKAKRLQRRALSSAARGTR